MLDDIDVRIIEKLSKNGRVSLTELSDGMELSRVAIANRIDKLLQNGLIHVGATINLEKLNYQTFIVELQISEKNLQAFKKLLSRSPQIIQGFETIGEFNWLLVCVDKSSKRLRQFIDSTLKKYADSCRVTIASVPHGPDFIHQKLSRVCKICELGGENGI